MSARMAYNRYAVGILPLQKTEQKCSAVSADGAAWAAEKTKRKEDGNAKNSVLEKLRQKRRIILKKEIFLPKKVENRQEYFENGLAFLKMQCYNECTFI